MQQKWIIFFFRNLLRLVIGNHFYSWMGIISQQIYYENINNMSKYKINHFGVSLVAHCYYMVHTRPGSITWKCNILLLLLPQVWFTQPRKYYFPGHFQDKITIYSQPFLFQVDFFTCNILSGILSVFFKF